MIKNNYYSSDLYDKAYQNTKYSDRLGLNNNINNSYLLAITNN